MSLANLAAASRSHRVIVLVTTGNVGSFISANKFVGTEEYNSNDIRWYAKPTNIVYIRWFGPGTNEYRGVWFYFDPTHIFVGEATSPTNICGLYLLVTWLHRQI
jgi:hypothetical protein